jgi:hypothetical protein
MTSSEQKIYDAVIAISREQAAFNAQFVDLKNKVDEHDVHIETMKDDRNKVIGVSWLGGALIALGGAIWEIYKHS